MLTSEILEQIHARCQGSEQNLYLLADHAGLPGLSRKLRENGIKWANLFGDDKRPALTEASPLLFEIAFSNGRPAKRRLLQWLDDNGRDSSSLLLISSPLSFQSLLEGLARRCDGVLSEGEAIVMRFFDTRVFPQLLDVMTEDERRIWLGIASGWWYVDRDGSTVHVSSECQPEDSCVAPMMVADSQMSRLLDASEIDQVAYLLESNVPEQFGSTSRAERYRLIQEKLVMAKELGLSSLTDKTLYCGLAFLHGADFEAQPQWQSVLSRVKTGELSLTLAAESVDEALSISEEGDVH
jgi:hypothetical protein